MPASRHLYVVVFGDLGSIPPRWSRGRRLGLRVVSSLALSPVFAADLVARARKHEISRGGSIAATGASQHTSELGSVSGSLW